MLSAKTSNNTILLVEDELLVRLDMAKFLAEAGFEVVDVANPEAALEVLQSQPVSVMINDIEMFSPVDGVGLAWRVSETWPAVNIIVISGLQRVEVGALPERARFLPKPFQAQDLIEIVRDRSA